MYSQFSNEIVKQRQQQLLAEAAASRLAKTAREGSRRQHRDEQRAVLGFGRAIDSLARFFHRTPECPDQVAPAR